MEAKTCRKSGFRISRSDVGVLIVGGCLAFFLMDTQPVLVQLITLLLGHFFLFCNVFRVGRHPEYLWGVLFIGNVLLWTHVSGFDAIRIALSLLPVTLGVIIYAITRPDYHGIGSAKSGEQ